MNTNPIKCDGCGKEVLPKNVFMAHDYKCCSMDCLKPLRDKKIEENKKTDQFRYQSAFSFQSGGGC
jgi:hypothetical protein